MPSELPFFAPKLGAPQVDKQNFKEKTVRVVDPFTNFFLWSLMQTHNLTVWINPEGIYAVVEEGDNKTMNPVAYWYPKELVRTLLHEIESDPDYIKYRAIEEGVKRFKSFAENDFHSARRTNFGSLHLKLAHSKRVG